MTNARARRLDGKLGERQALLIPTVEEGHLAPPFIHMPYKPEPEILNPKSYN